MQTYENLLREIVIPWQNIRRWRGKPRPKTENVLMHTFKECINTIYVLSLEKDNVHPIDNAKVLVAKLFHDIGEGLLGCDIPYPIKKDRRLGNVFEEIERDEIEKFLNRLPTETKKFLISSVLKILNNDVLYEGKLCNAIEYYGYISFAFAEIKTEGKGNSNVIGFYKVLEDHGDKLWRYEKNFQFVKNFKELTRLLQNCYFNMEFWLPEFTLRKILDVWTDPRLGRAWPDLETNENLLVRTMKTAFLAAFLLPQEKAYKTRIDDYKVLCTALAHKLDKMAFPVLAPKMRKNKKLRKYERGFRQLQKEHLAPLLAEFSPEAHAARDVVLQAYELEKDRNSIEGRFFDAVKNLSYVMFAHYEWSRGKKEFRQVFKNCDSDLMEYCKEFKSVKETYLPIKADFEKGEQDKFDHAEILERIERLEKENAESKKKISEKK